MPNCLGAIDGKHVPIVRPKMAGSLFYNYKGFHSINLLAISDANYKFIYCNVGAYGSENDASVLASDQIGSMILENKLPLPDAAYIGGK